MPRAAIFWSGHGHCLVDLATDREIDAGPFESLHAAWLEAHTRGLFVVDVWTTRRTAKPRRRQPIEEPAT